MDTILIGTMFAKKPISCARVAIEEATVLHVTRTTDLLLKEDVFIMLKDVTLVSQLKKITLFVHSLLVFNANHVFKDATWIPKASANFLTQTVIPLTT